MIHSTLSLRLTIGICAAQLAFVEALAIEIDAEHRVEYFECELDHLVETLAYLDYKNHSQAISLASPILQEYGLLPLYRKFLDECRPIVLDFDL